MKRLISLLAAAAAVVLLSTPGFAQSSYTWELDCRGATLGVGVGTGVSWAWLHNGVQISSAGFSSCVTPPLDGSGDIPATINGMLVNGIEIDASLEEDVPAGCGAITTVTKSIDPSNPKVSTTVNVSAPATNSGVFGIGKGSPCPKASFHFRMTN